MASWIIQDGVFGAEEQGRTVEALRSLNIPYEIVDIGYNSFAEGKELSFFRGSVEFVAGQSLGLDIKLENYDCSNYYMYYLPVMLNRDFFVVPWAVLFSEGEQYFDWFKSDKIFIRPNSGKKIFTGNYVTEKWWKEDLRTIGSLPNNNPENQDLVVVTSHKELGNEYRVLMDRYTPIDCDVYSQVTEVLGWKDKVMEEARKLAAQYYWYPDDFYTMDLTFDEQDQQFKIVEFNNLFSAGWYDCDYNKVVETINNKKV